MSIIVPSVGRLTAATLPQVIQPTRNGHCDVDLRSVKVIDAAGIVLIAAVAEHASMTRSRVQVKAPENTDVRRYLSNVRLGAVLDSLGVPHNLGGRRVRPSGDHVRELRHFGSEAELTNVADSIVEAFLESGIEDEAVAPLYDALFELGVNAVEHSQQGGGYVALETPRRTKTVAFAIGDSGIGLRGSLADAGSDEEAMRMAARKYVSSVRAKSRGRGITGVIELTGSHHGQVTLVSGSVQGEFSRGHWDPRVSRLRAPFHGTVAQAELALEGRLE